MSTIASPRPSISLSSRRGSASTDNTVTSTSTKPASSAAERGSLRRNRTALRDYYNLKAAAPADGRDVTDTPTLDAEQESELDRPGFDPTAYVQGLLSHQSLEAVLRVEAGLLSDVRTLDGEKKALVYDNYSKLIAATDTIKSMREKMMTPTTSTLSPAIGHIAETAATLTADLKKSHSTAVASRDADRNVQQALVRWVLAAPDRIGYFIGQGDVEAAQRDWTKVSGYLDKWHHVKGVDKVRERCEDALATNNNSG